MAASAEQQLRKLLTPRLTKYIPYTPTPKQTAFLLMNGTRELLYGGAAGGGKSIAQLMAALQFVDIPGYSAILFRQSYADLSLPGALMDVAKEWLMPFVLKKEVHWAEKDKRYTFPSGATLNFGYLESSNDCYRYQGAEFQYIGIDEVTHISPSNYTYMFSRLRKSVNIEVPLRFRATANPGGEFGDYYYQRFFVEGKEKGRVFIGANIYDNPYLDAEAYIESLNELPPLERERLLNGNWEVQASGDLFAKAWFHTVPYTDIPLGARRVRYWDMASTDPSKRLHKKMRDPDWTVGLLLAHHNGIYWIEDIERKQVSPRNQEDIIRAMAIKDGAGTAIRMEQEPGSSGEITVSHYARNVLNGYDFKGVRSTGSKVERARPASAAAQSGRILICQRCRNMLPFLDEAETFPYGTKDDIVDALSGAFNHFRQPALMVAPTSLRKAGGSYWHKFKREVVS
jgi:predicted phage terminase large subunit-like protein